MQIAQVADEEIVASDDRYLQRGLRTKTISGNLPENLRPIATQASITTNVHTRLSLVSPGTDAC